MRRRFPWFSEGGPWPGLLCKSDHQGVLLAPFFYKSEEDFPFLDIENGYPIPPGSLTARTDLEQGIPSDSEERDGAIWLSSRGRRTPRIWEQVLPQSEGYKLTLLSLAEDLEDIEEEEDLEKAYTPRFRR